MKKISKYSNSILALAIIICCFVGLTFPVAENILSPENAYNYYSTGVALGYFLISLSVFSCDVKNGVKFLFFSLTLNNIIDEVFFDNTRLGINEIISIVIIIVIYTNRYVSRGNNKDKPTYRGNS